MTGDPMQPPWAALNELADRMADQHARLTGPPIPADFTYDRNGLRLGIAALEDELRELHDEWTANKKRLREPGVAEQIRHEALDVAAVAMLIVRNIPASGHMPAETCSLGCPVHDPAEAS